MIDHQLYLDGYYNVEFDLKIAMTHHCFQSCTSFLLHHRFEEFELDMNFHDNYIMIESSFRKPVKRIKNL